MTENLIERAAQSLEALAAEFEDKAAAARLRSSSVVEVAAAVFAADHCRLQALRLRKRAKVRVSS